MKYSQILTAIPFVIAAVCAPQRTNGQQVSNVTGNMDCVGGALISGRWHVAMTNNPDFDFTVKREKDFTMTATVDMTDYASRQDAAHMTMFAQTVIRDVTRTASQKCLSGAVPGTTNYFWRESERPKGFPKHDILKPQPGNKG